MCIFDVNIFGIGAPSHPQKMIQKHEFSIFFFFFLFRRSCQSDTNRTWPRSSWRRRSCRSLLFGFEQPADRSDLQSHFRRQGNCLSRNWLFWTFLFLLKKRWGTLSTKYFSIWLFSHKKAIHSSIQVIKTK